VLKFRDEGTTRKSYPSDVSDAEWEFLVPYLTLMREDAPQRSYSSRELLNAMRYVVKTGCQWRLLPHDFPPWSAVSQQMRRPTRRGRHRWNWRSSNTMKTNADSCCWRCCWVVEQMFGWLGRFRRLARDDERLADTLKNRRWLAFLGPLLKNIVVQST
jgi:transposase